MILFIRNENNDTIIDIEIYKAKEDNYEYVEVSSVVDILHYTDFLLDKIEKGLDKDEIASSFYFFQEIRGWFYEVYLKNGKNIYSDELLDDVIKEIKNLMLSLCDEYSGLYYMED